MKKIAKHIVAYMLALIARAVIHRYNPHIVMVSGSVGKTSTKDAVALVLATRFLVRKSEKSFNSDFGVPFTIIGINNPWRNVFAWFSLLKRAIALLILPNQYPNMLVLEVGADKQGGITSILRMATPEAVVLTRLPDVPVHVEAYASPEAVREEEFSPACALEAEAPLIVSEDDAYSMERAMRIPPRTISYGVADGAKVRISNVGFYVSDKNVIGMRADVVSDGEHGEIIVKGAVGTVQVFPLAAAIATARAFDIPFSKALKALEAYEPPRGRARLLKGRNGSHIIDDSYNASPIAMEHALTTLKTFPYASRRIAVLGDMLELGRYSVDEHTRIGVLARESADIVVAVGVRARVFVLGNVDKDDNALFFNTSNEAALALAKLAREGDVILVKGSQSIRTEYIVKALLADISDVAQLVRQEKEWQSKP